jgi:fumarate hydratase subunit alpha
MKNIIESKDIYEAIKAGIKETGVRLPKDVKQALKKAIAVETGPAEKVLRHISLNLETAEKENMPMCQDTGMVVVFVEMGNDVEIQDAFINDVINDAIRDAYEEAFLENRLWQIP